VSASRVRASIHDRGAESTEKAQRKKKSLLCAVSVFSVALW